MHALSDTNINTNFSANCNAHFKLNYQHHLQHLKLKGLQPKTIDAYARAIRRIGVRFDYQIDQLSEQQLADYFTELLTSHSWSSVKLDLYGLKFYTTHVLKKPWESPSLIKPPRSQRLPDIVTVEEARRLSHRGRCTLPVAGVAARATQGLQASAQLRLSAPQLQAPDRLATGATQIPADSELGMD